MKCMIKYKYRLYHTSSRQHPILSTLPTYRTPLGDQLPHDYVGEDKGRDVQQGAYTSDVRGEHRAVGRWR